MAKAKGNVRGGVPILKPSALSDATVPAKVSHLFTRPLHHVSHSLIIIVHTSFMSFLHFRPLYFMFYTSFMYLVYYAFFMSYMSFSTFVYNVSTVIYL